MDRVAAHIRRFARRLTGQAGMALAASLGMSLVLGISGTTALVYSTGNYRGASTSKAEQRALSLAEMGLNNAYSTLYNASDPTMPGAVPVRSGPLEDGTVTWSGTLDTQTNVWTLTGTGQIPNPTGSAATVRTVRGKVRISGASNGGANNAVWNYIYAEAPTSCTTLSNSVNVSVPFYVKGDLCLQNSARISGSNTVLQVGGTLSISNSATAGLSTAFLAEAHIGGGCQLNAGPIHLACGPADRVYALVTDSTVANLDKPTVDIPYWYTNAKPGPMQGCTIGAFPGGFDTDTTLNRSLATAVNLTPATSYDCRVYDGGANLVGRLAWNPVTRILTVLGTIFFDGNIVMQNGATAVYQGRSTIYASGTITLQNAAQLCGVGGCNSAWQATQNLLCLVAGSSTDTVGFSVQNSAKFQGAIYVVNDYSEQNSADVWGPIIARQVNLMNSVTNHYVPLGTLLPGMPGESSQAVTLSNEPGSWG